MTRIVPSGTSWLPCLRRYLLFLTLANLLWEVLHMPLYALWNDGNPRQIIAYGLHCVGGDMLIGAASLLLALVVFAKPDWPSRDYWRIGIIATSFGFLYTLWSEWYNVTVAGRWAYSAAMPVIPLVEVGVSPLAQWLVIPMAGFWWTKR